MFLVGYVEFLNLTSHIFFGNLKLEMHLSFQANSIKLLTSMATVVEHSKIPPAADTMPEFSLPLVFFDMLWYDFAANQSVVFFELPSSSKSQILNTIVPHLKASLSQALTHFLPLAGNIIHPLNPGVKPSLRYRSGDSINFTVCESNGDFDHLIGNNPRNCEEFYSLAPLLPSATHSENSVSCPVLALQVTIFAGKGLSIGFVTHHAVADASTVVAFIHAWANINHGGLNITLPDYDRNSIMNLNGLDSFYWDLILKLSDSIEPPPIKTPINKVRSTFVLKKDEIEKLKNLVVAKFPGGVAHLSSFAVVCALAWVCYARSATEEVAADEAEYFGFVADCRRRLNPPLPDNYFGNCVALVRTELKNGEVKGSDGFVTAAKAIGEAIKENVYGEKGILHGAANWPDEYAELVGKRLYGVAGSPRFDFYAADFGWGKPSKFEALFIDVGGSISLCKSRDFEGGLEIGLSMPVLQMDAFSTVFKDLLTDLLSNPHISQDPNLTGAH